MTRHHNTTDTVRRPTPPEHTPRLRLKPKAPHTGYVDGAWWPHSDDLVNELPDLLAVLGVRLGTVDRVLYKVADWATAPAELVTDDGAVRLDGYRLQPPNTIEVLGRGGNRAVLLVVPPHTGPDRAHATLMVAYLCLLIGLGAGLVAVGAPPRVMRRMAWVVGLVVMQGSIGVVQYHTGVPAVLVALHVAGAAAATAATAVLWASMRQRTEPEAIQGRLDIQSEAALP